MSEGRNGCRDFQQWESDLRLFSPWNTDRSGERPLLYIWNARGRRFPPPVSATFIFISPSAALFFFLFTASSLSSSFLSHRPMIQSALRSLGSVFSTVTLCWLVSHACLNTPRWRVNALLTYALTPDEERLTVAAGGQDDDRIRTSWTAAVGQLQLFPLTVGLIDPVVSPCWLSTGWEGQGMCRELSFLSDVWCLSAH